MQRLVTPLLALFALQAAARTALAGDWLHYPADENRWPQLRSHSCER